MTPAGIEPAAFQFVAQHLNQCATTVPLNNNSIANCIFYLTKQSNQPENGSYLEPKHVIERNSVRNTP